MTGAVIVFTLLYVVVCFVFVFRSTEFASEGLTVENLFGLDDEFRDFIGHHLKRTTLTLLFHSFLPLGYLIGLSFVTTVDNDEIPGYIRLWWFAFRLFCVTYPALTLLITCRWSLSDWYYHPIVCNLRHFCNNNTTSWRALAADINAEYRRFEKIVLRTSSITSIICTDNWLLKVTMYNVRVSHQSDSVLILVSADTDRISPTGEDVVQYVNIEVKSTRPGVDSFYIRCNALDFRNLQNAVSLPVSILQGITFHKTRTDQFLDIFKESVSQNPIYVHDSQQELDSCIGCMLVVPNVKLRKNCLGDCGNCYCRPLWCIDCMGKWFASRQEQDRPETWLSSKCTCPVCRSMFCLLDVCPLRQQ